MRGTVLIFKPHDPQPMATEVDRPLYLYLPSLKVEIGGGDLEPVPLFNFVCHNGVVQRCVAFCDADARLKQLPYNKQATELWNAAAHASRGRGCAPYYLAGHIAIVFGDKEFMKAL